MTQPKITKIAGKCQWTGCDKNATDIAEAFTPFPFKLSPYHPDGLACYCEKHAEAVAGEHSEYTECCPNCGCIFSRDS